MRHALVTTSALLVLAACTTSPNVGDAGIDGGDLDTNPPRDAATIDAWVPPVPTTTIAAANAVGPSDPMWEGQQRFLYDTWGTERSGEWPPAEWLVALMAREPSVFGNQFSAFGFLPDHAADLPIGLRRGLEDPAAVHHTCGLCHVGRLPDGSLWLGAPNRDLDLIRFRYEMNMRWVADGNRSLLSALDERKALAYGPGRFAADPGDYPTAVPADFPPYWLLGARTAMNYLGTGRDLRSEVFLSLFAFGAGDPNVLDGGIPFPSQARVAPFLAFMGSMQSPPAPSGDASMIAVGMAVYQREQCGACHHVDAVAMNGVTPYDRAAGGLERLPGVDALFPRGSIRTDYDHRVLVDGVPARDGGADVDAGGSRGDLAGFIAFIGRNRLSVRNSDGYRVDDLHGLWATAPYLHNGSVPTLDALLRPAAMRPRSFLRGTFLVDTTQPGNSNQGHEFGTAISAPDRAALVAYLLSL